MGKAGVLFAIAAGGVMLAVCGLADFARGDDALVQVSTAASPRVAYSVERRRDAVVVVVAVEPFDAESSRQPAGGVGVRLGAAAGTLFTALGGDYVRVGSVCSLVYALGVVAMACQRRQPATATGDPSARFGTTRPAPVRKPAR